jgi:hypothetical protein
MSKEQGKMYPNSQGGYRFERVNELGECKVCGSVHCLCGTMHEAIPASEEQPGDFTPVEIGPRNDASGVSFVRNNCTVVSYKGRNLVEFSEIPQKKHKIYAYECDDQTITALFYALLCRALHKGVVQDRQNVDRVLMELGIMLEAQNPGPMPF